MLRQNHLKRSRLQEKRGEKQYQGKRTPGSGNGWIKKADVLTETEMIEFKTTTKSSYPLSTTVLNKLWKQAIIDNKIPILTVEFSDHGMTCVVLDENDYLAIKEHVDEIRKSS